ncbi:MAG: phospholipid-binding protein MlaC [Candidatus Binatia bacterium]
MKATKCIFSGLLALVVYSLPSLGWAADSPMGTVKQLIDSVRSYKPETSSLSDKERATNNQVAKVVEDTLNVQDLAKRVLGPQWDKLKANERQDFIQLMTSLFQKIGYPKSAEFFGDLQIDFRKEQVNGSSAVVETVISHPKEGQVDIHYQLRQVRGRWMIDDVLLDGVSLVMNVRSQMQQVITKESYQGLVKRMREKLEES